MSTTLLETSRESHCALWEPLEELARIPLMDVAARFAEQGFERVGGMRELDPNETPDGLVSNTAYFFVDPSSSACFSVGVRLHSRKHSGFLERRATLVLELLEEESLEPVSSLCCEPLLHLVGAEPFEEYLERARTRLDEQLAGPLLQVALEAFSR